MKLPIYFKHRIYTIQEFRVQYSLRKAVYCIDRYCIYFIFKIYTLRLKETYNAFRLLNISAEKKRKKGQKSGNGRLLYDRSSLQREITTRPSFPTQGTCRLASLWARQACASFITSLNVPRLSFISWTSACTSVYELKPSTSFSRWSNWPDRLLKSASRVCEWIGQLNWPEQLQMALMGLRVFDAN